MAEKFEDVDPAAMRQALTTFLPDREPPIGLRVEHVKRLGRRRAQVRRAVPLAVAVITAAAVAVPWMINAALTTRVAGNPVPATSEPYRLPQGHHWDQDATTLARVIVDQRVPPGRITSYFGSRSDVLDGGARYGYGLHELWQEDGHYGYLLVLHRTKGAYPATDYGLPAEPCAEPGTRLPEYHCAPVPVPAGDTATSFDVDNGYRMRGIVWDMKDPAGGADIRVTGIFYLPAAGAWTPFPELDTQPRLATIPVSVPDLVRIIGIPG